MTRALHAAPGTSDLPGNKWLLTAGILSGIAALLHIAVIIGGPDWYRFVGAGEGMARAAERGSFTPHLITLGIAGLLAIWMLYAFSAAGLVRRLPLLRTGLIVISGIYLVRAFALVPLLFISPGGPGAFDVWSSLIVLVYGLAYAVGTWLAWPRLRPRGATSLMTLTPHSG